MLFSIYDVDGSGGIDYKEFSGVVFGRIASGVPKGSPGGGAASSGGAGGNDPEALAVKLKEKLATRGARGIIGL
jgi:hypothetical protein